jgi:hypothetical protein
LILGMWFDLLHICLSFKNDLKQNSSCFYCKSLDFLDQWIKLLLSYIYIYIYIYTQSQCNPSNFKISEKSLVYCSIRTKSPNQIKSDGPGQCSVSPNNVQTGASPGVFKPLNCCLLFKLLSLSNSPAVGVSLLPNFISGDG